jgi:rRNA maturation endonuclease Nob1
MQRAFRNITDAEFYRCPACTKRIRLFNRLMCGPCGHHVLCVLRNFHFEG